jgi:hypothetical protein
MNRPSPASRHAAATADTAAIRAHYQSLLHALCDGQAAEPATAAAIVERQACVLEDIGMEFRLNEASGEVELFLDLGRPAPGQEAAFYRRLLEIQLQQGVSPFWVLGAHPVSGHGVMMAQFLMTETGDDYSSFRLFLQVCIDIARMLRGQL